MKGCPPRRSRGQKGIIVEKSMLQDWLNRYNELDRLYDYEENKLERHESEGNTERANRNAQRMNMIHAEMRGLVTALSIFGYTVVWQDGKAVVVENC